MATQELKDIGYILTQLQTGEWKRQTVYRDESGRLVMHCDAAYTLDGLVALTSNQRDKVLEDERNQS